MTHPRRPTGLLVPVSLSDEQLDLIRDLADGLSTDQIAKKIHYSDRTVKWRIGLLCSQLGARNRTHLVATALRWRIIE